MQEIFELLINDALDAAQEARDEMLRNIDIVSLLNHMKLEREKANKHYLHQYYLLEKYEEKHVIDASDEFAEDDLAREVYEFARIVETMDWAIDLIESGKFVRHHNV